MVGQDTIKLDFSKFIKHAWSNETYKRDNNKDGAFVFDLLYRFRGWESMKPNELLGRDNHPIKLEEIAKVCPDIIKVLGDHDKDDYITELVSLHVGGEARLWAHRKDNIFYVLFYDPRHEIYPMQHQRKKGRR